MKKKLGANVYVGDFGKIIIPDKMIKAYGLRALPINRRSSTQRRREKEMYLALAVLQRHAWLMGDEFTL